MTPASGRMPGRRVESFPSIMFRGQRKNRRLPRALVAEDREGGERERQLDHGRADG
jgi:hypothetical protein